MTRMQWQCGCDNVFSPIWAISCGSEAIGLSYGPIGIVWWLSSGGGNEEGSLNIGGTEAMLGVGGLLCTSFFAALLGNGGSSGQIGRCHRRGNARLYVAVEGWWGGAMGERGGIVKVRRLIVQLGSWCWQQKNNVQQLTPNSTKKKYGTPIILRSF